MKELKAKDKIMCYNLFYNWSLRISYIKHVCKRQTIESIKNVQTFLQLYSMIIQTDLYSYYTLKFIPQDVITKKERIDFIKVYGSITYPIKGE